MEGASWHTGPRSGGKILDLAFNIYFGNILRLLASAAVIVVPLTIVLIVLNVIAFGEPSSITDAGLVDIGDTTRQVDYNLYNALQIVGTVLSVLAYLLVVGATYTAANAAYLGEEVSARDSVGTAVRKLHSLLWVSLLTFFFVFIGVFALIVGAFYAAVMLAVAIPVLMVEDVRGFKACRRSYRLIRKNGWRTLGVLFVVAIFTGAVELIIGLAALAANGLAESHIYLWVVVTQILGGVAFAFTAPLTAVASVVLYYDCRIRKEGYDIQRLAEGLEPATATGTAGAPGLSPPAPVPPPPPPPGPPPAAG